MSKKFIASALLALLVCMSFVATASAFQYRMRYGQAKNASRRFAIALCREDPECTGFAVGQCYRRSLSGFDCEIANFDPLEPGEELECNVNLHWGVSYEGFVELKNAGHPHCFPVPA